MATNLNGATVCKHCSRSIIFATNETGRKIALELTQEVYAIVYPGPRDSWAAKRAKREVYVNHSMTCMARRG